MLEFYRFIGDVVIYISPVIALLYFIGFTKNSKAYKVFAIYLLSMALIQLASYFVGRGWLNRNNLYYSHYYFIAQFVLLSLFYFELLRSRIIKIILFIVLLFVGYQFVSDSGIYYRYNPLGMSITHIMLVAYAMIYLYRSLKDNKKFVIVSVGLLFYLLSSTLIFASGNLVLDLDLSLETRRTLINVNRFLSLLFQFLLLFEWWRHHRPRKH